MTENPEIIHLKSTIKKFYTHSYRSFLSEIFEIGIIKGFVVRWWWWGDFWLCFSCKSFFLLQIENKIKINGNDYENLTTIILIEKLENWSTMTINRDKARIKTIWIMNRGKVKNDLMIGLQIKNQKESDSNEQFFHSLWTFSFTVRLIYDLIAKFYVMTMSLLAPFKNHFIADVTKRFLIG